MIPFISLIDEAMDFLRDILRFSRSEDEEDSNRTYRNESE